MTKDQRFLTSIGMLLLVVGACTETGQPEEVAQGPLPGEIPLFELDPDWPKPLPNNWVFGSVSGVTVDDRDHVWFITRPREQWNDAQRNGTAAPSVIEFDAEGNFIQAWGGPGEGYEWPTREHGITVDANGFVWIAGSGTDDHQILKFTRDGQFVMQIGRAGQSKGNTDTLNLNQPADVTHYPPTNEILVADGYGNRRIIVFDAETGAYKRMWGAFGNVPTDPLPGEPTATEDKDAVGPGPQQFSTNVHGVRVSNDGLVYVADRDNQRLQVFTLAGEYLTQTFITRGPQPLSTATDSLFGRPRADVENGLRRSPEAVSRTAFSSDPEQRFLYVLDRRYQRIQILDRQSLEVLGSFGGGPGDGPGQFYVLHDMATDSQGNMYTAEINMNGRPQKFAFRGYGPRTP